MISPLLYHWLVSCWIWKAVSRSRSTFWSTVPPSRLLVSGSPCSKMSCRCLMCWSNSGWMLSHWSGCGSCFVHRVTKALTRLCGQSSGVCVF